MAKLSESQNIELLAELSNFNEVSKAACAFANADGGKIILGVASDGLVVGVNPGKLDELQQRIEGAVQVVSPMPLHKIIVEELEGKKVVVTEVYQIGSDSFCTSSGIVYYRFGSENRKLEGRTLQEYLINRKILSFDETKSTAVLSDIDAEKVGEYLRKRSPAVEFHKGKLEEYLFNLGMVEKNGGALVKNACVLFFAKNPSRFIPQSEVRLVRFKGLEAVDIIDSAYVGAAVLENLNESEQFVRKNTRMAFKIESLQREEIPEYPHKAIREALVNALAHRDYFSKDSIQVSIYDNRIEITNPGALPTGLTLKMLGTLSVQRNHLTYRLLRDIQLVEGLATGIPRMRSAMRDAGLPEPRFEELGSFFRVTLFNSKQPRAVELNERQRRGLAYLEKNPSINTKTYAKLSSTTVTTAIADLKQLVKKGLLRKVGKTRGAYYCLSQGSG